MSHFARSLPWTTHYQKHPGQLIREDLTFKVHPLQLFVDRKQGQICSFEIREVGGGINGCLILDDIKIHLFNARQKKRKGRKGNKPDEWRKTKNNFTFNSKANEATI